MEHASKRPLTSRSRNGSNPDCPPLPLRPSRSAMRLRPKAQELPKPPGLNSFATSVADQRIRSTDFVVDELPPPGAPFAVDHELRRVQSSSALSVGGASPANSALKGPSVWKNALSEAQYVASSLVSRPAESTRHYSIIRHSHALVWYRGPSTAVSISVLSDEPLPATRTLWLQQKGYSGNMGMTVKTLLGSTRSWLDVTPVNHAQPEHLPEVDERGIQRDLKRFAKKASGRLKGHIPRETHIVRIPAAAADGYFRLVLCADKDGKKALCGSPVFRVASTSTDVAVVRGAGVMTMPLELGVKVASTIGQQAAKKYMGVAGAVAQNGAAKVVKAAGAKRVGQVVHQGYRHAGLDDAVNESWKRNKLREYGQLSNSRFPEAHLSVIESDSGPAPPFPIIFEGRVARATGMSTVDLGFPTANLSGIPETIKMQFKGVFAAWAIILPAEDLEDVSHDWHEAVATIAPPRHAPLSVAMHNDVAVHIAHDFNGAVFFGAKLRVVLMGYLHPAAVNDNQDTSAGEYVQDVISTLAILGQANWAPPLTVIETHAVERGRSFSDRLDEATGKVQRSVNRIPLHLAGVRSEHAALRDGMYGNGGLWISR